MAKEVRYSLCPQSSLSVLNMILLGQKKNRNLCLLLNTERFNPVALRKVKIIYKFGLSECNRIVQMLNTSVSECEMHTR